MSKLQQILTYLESEKLDVAVVSDPVTINYLTGFYSDPHERQMFLFVLADQEPLLFVPALEVERASSTVPVVGYVDSENPWQKIKHALPQLDFKRVAVEFDNLILTKYHGLKTVLKLLSLKTSLLVSNACASSNQLMKYKNDGCRSLC